MNRRVLLFGRALTLRCPHCGGRHVLRHWLAMRESCPDCGLQFATGNRPGAYILNLFATGSVLMIVLLTIFLRTWPNPPYTLLQWLAPALMVATPMILYPFSKMLFVAIDLAMHPEAAPDALVHGSVRKREERREEREVRHCSRRLFSQIASRFSPHLCHTTYAWEPTQQQRQLSRR